MEQNRENLRRAIDQMSEYQPPGELWHDLEELLDFEQKLEAPLQEMPLLTPPATVWTGLAERVEQAPELKPKSQFHPAWKWLIGALLLAFFIGWRMLKPKPTLAHRTEVVDDDLIMVSRRADDPSYNIVETLCQEALPVCEEPQFKQLKAELDDLTHAHSELKNALGDFADDPEMIAQLIEIEHIRYQILQQLIAMM
jgi:hypothetical protein